MSDSAYQREYPRVERILLTSVEQYNIDGELAESRIGRTLNVSEGGILLEVDHPLPFLSKVSLNIAIKEDIIKADGEVVHLRRTKDGKIEMGIKFLDIPADDRMILENHLTG